MSKTKKVIQIIDLLNKIANGEEVPKKIIYKNNEYVLVVYGKDKKIYQEIYEPFEVLSINTACLNDEVEIIEEDKKMEKLEVRVWDKCIHNATHTEKELAIDIRTLQEKVNEIIDKVNELESEIDNG